MREIKFRAWHKELRIMVYRGVYDRNWYTKDKDGKLFEGIHPDDRHEMILMQFTGLKDCNGKQIYEGDIVKPYSTEKTKNLSVIVYDFNQFRIKGTYLYWNWDLRQVEIVGNICENPEIL